MPKRGSLNSGARNHGWYVVQVRTGQEDRMCSLIERACGEHDEAVEDGKPRVGLRECFSPRFRTQKKWKGGWKDVERPLIPGYVIADAARPEVLAQVLASEREFCRLLAKEETYEPLDEYERTWIASYTEKGDRVVPMSFGYREGDTLVVTRGPLRGREAMVTAIDRANSLAHLEFHAGPITLKTTVGLGVLPEPEGGNHRR